MGTCRIAVITFFCFTAVAGAAATDTGTAFSGSIAFMTYADSAGAGNAAARLLDSIRAFAGIYRDAPLYVAVTDPDSAASRMLATAGAILVPLPAEDPALRYYYGVKPIACARVEELVAASVDTLIYLDPETLVLAQPDRLVLDSATRIALRPVSLNNSIGQPPATEPDHFWNFLFTTAGAAADRLPAMETFVDGKTIRAYYNCIIFAVHPADGLCAEWLRVFRAALADSPYQRQACADTLHRIFLHQAVFTAVIAARLPTEAVMLLPREYTFPLNLLERVPEEKRPARLNDLVTVAFEGLWDRPHWRDKLTIEEPLADWLRQEYLLYGRVMDRISRLIGSCSSYLIRCCVGSELIDSGGK